MDVIQVAALWLLPVFCWQCSLRAEKQSMEFIWEQQLSILIFFQILGKLNVILEVVKTIMENSYC